MTESESLELMSRELKRRDVRIAALERKLAECQEGLTCLERVESVAPVTLESVMRWLHVCGNDHRVQVIRRAHLLLVMAGGKPLVLDVVPRLPADGKGG